MTFIFILIGWYVLVFALASTQIGKRITLTSTGLPSFIIVTAAQITVALLAVGWVWPVFPYIAYQIYSVVTVILHVGRITTYTPKKFVVEMLTIIVLVAIMALA